jgi:lysophospholipase L1-like esterase
MHVIGGQHDRATAAAYPGLMRASRSSMGAIGLLAASILLLIGPASSRAKPARPPLPGSMAATGDSITRAFNAGLQPFTDSPARSWATGDDAEVSSVYRRLLARDRRIRDHALNVARTGARVADVRRQVGTLAGRPVEYVTILVGANDACTATEHAMTPVAAFRTEMDTALATLHSTNAGVAVSVLSIPDVRRLFEISRTRRTARAAWLAFGICQAMFANPRSNAPGDVQRRDRVAARIVDYNGELAAACARYPSCTWDGGAVHSYPFEREHVSTRDYFHPSRAGQRTLAAVAWRAAFPRVGTLTPDPLAEPVRATPP